MSQTLSNFHDVIAFLLLQHKTYEEISIELSRLGVTRGSSPANVRKYCRDNGVNIRAGVVSDDMLHAAVSSAVEQVVYSFRSTPNSANGNVYCRTFFKENLSLHKRIGFEGGQMVFPTKRKPEAKNYTSLFHQWRSQKFSMGGLRDEALRGGEGVSPSPLGVGSGEGAENFWIFFISKR